MKMKIAAGSAVVAVALASLVWASPAMATGGGHEWPPPNDCTPSEAVDAWIEDVPDIIHPAVDAIPAVYEVEYKFVHKFDHLHLFPKWKTDPNWNAEENDHSLGWLNTGETRQGALITPEVPGVEAWTEVTPDIEHPAIPAVVCDVEVTAAVPTWVDDCEKGDAHWVYTDTAAYTYETWNFGKYKVIKAVATEGHILTGEVQWSDFEKVKECLPEEVPLPAQYSINPTVADCGVAGSLDFEGGLFEHVTLSIDPAYDGPGTYTISADTEAGYVFPDGTTHKEREVTVPEALVYQSENSEAPCYLAPPVTVTLANPVVLDPCGAENDEVTLPEDTEGVVYTFASDDVTNFDVRATVQDGFVVETVPAGWSGSEGVYVYAVDLTNTTCTGGTTPPGTTPASNPTTGGLAATGGGDVGPLMPLAGGLTVALGIVLMLMRRFARI